MGTTCRFLLVFLALTLSIPAARAGGPIVAVFEMEDKGSGLGGKVLTNLTDYLGVLLTKGGYRVVPRTEVQERIKDQKKKSYDSCYDQKCQIELGRELAAEKTLATWILKIGDSCQVTATLYDLKKATTELASAQEAACEEGSLLQAIKAISDDLCKGLDLAGVSARDAEIKAAVARREAEDARREARQKTEELERMRREIEAVEERARKAEAARLESQQKVQQLDKAQSTANAEELRKARLEARLARERARKAEAEQQAMLSRTGELEQIRREAEQARRVAKQKSADLEQSRKEARLAKERAEQAERDTQLAQEARIKAEQRAEEATRAAELARKHPEGLPTEVFNLGIGILAIAPNITKPELDHPGYGNRTISYQGGFGVVINLDFMINPYLSLGTYLVYGQGEIKDPDYADVGGEDEYTTTHLMAVLPSIKGRFKLGFVEFRPGLALGYQHFNGGPGGKVNGLGLSPFLQTAFYLGRHFALTLDLQANFYPVSAGSDADLTYYTPLLLLTLGAEYCD